MDAIKVRRLLTFGLALPAAYIHSQTVTLHTNFYYFGPVKEVFEAYTREDGTVVKQGIYRAWNEQGRLREEAHYNDGKFHGTVITFYPNGRKASERMFDDGVEHGVSTEWTRDGLIIAHGTNEHGSHRNGSFVVTSTYSVRFPGDEDIHFYVSEFQNGVAAKGEPKEIFDDGTKWKPAYALDERRLLRWFRYPYEIQSKYPYLKSLPQWSEIPTLFKWINSDEKETGVDVAYSQLVALSRADFGNPSRPRIGGLDSQASNYYRTQYDQLWKQWWETVGKSYQERLAAHGRQNEKAWRLITREQQRPLPDYKITIPDEWVFKSYYRAGDYGGVQTESITLCRTKNAAILVRAWRKETRGELQWEQWKSMTLEQADDFAFALGYAIDHPWVLKSNEPKEQSARQKLEGRELTTYHPKFDYEFGDLNGNLWWNDDPSSWHGAERTEDNFLNAPGNLGPVCILLWRTFPEELPQKPPPEDSRPWAPVRTLPAAILQQWVNDLSLRGEVIGVLRNSGRLLDALNGLTHFGTAQEVPGLARFETELQQRMREVEPIVRKDPNSQLTRMTVNRLLAASASAKSEIAARSK